MTKPTTAFTALQPALSRGIAIAARAANSSSSLPVLGNILIAATKGDGLCLTATDLTMSITVDVGADVAEGVAVTLPAKTLLDLVNTMPDSQVSLALNTHTQTATINCGRTRASVKGIRADDFPAIPRLDPDKATPLDGATLRSMLRRVVYATAAPGLGRPALEAVLMMLDVGRLTLAASDGFRVVEDSRAVDYSGEPVSALLPARAAQELAKMLDGAEEVLMQVEHPRVIFRAGAVEVAMMTIDGAFPKYRAILPTSYSTRVVLDAGQLARACRSVDIIAREAAHCMTVVVKPGEDGGAGSVSLSGEAAETGDNRAEIDATIEGDEVRVSLNARFVLEPVEAFGTEQVAIEIGGPSKPVVLRPVGDDSAWCVVMPFAL